MILSSENVTIGVCLTSSRNFSDDFRKHWFANAVAYVRQSQVPRFSPFHRINQLCSCLSSMESIRLECSSTEDASSFERIAFGEWRSAGASGRPLSQTPFSPNQFFGWYHFCSNPQCRIVILPYVQCSLLVVRIDIIPPTQNRYKRQWNQRFCR